MEIKMATRNELVEMRSGVENEFNETKDKLATYIKSTESIIKSFTDKMNELSLRYKEINEEIDRRDGKPSKE